MDINNVDDECSTTTKIRKFEEKSNDIAMNDYRISNLNRCKTRLTVILDAGCERRNLVNDYKIFKTWFNDNKCEIGISPLNYFGLDDYVTIQESKIIQNFDKNECVRKQLMNYGITKKLVGDQKLTRKQWIALMMYYRERTQNEYKSKISKKATGN